jgi:outer membrane protein assembly factor BamB
MVYVPCSGPDSWGGLCALNVSDGALLWTYGTNLTGEGSASVDGSTVYFGTYISGTYNQLLSALDAQTGTPKWSFQAGGSGNGNSENAPVAAGGSVYWLDNTGTLYALKAKSGTELWNTNDSNCGFQTNASLANGVVYENSGKANCPQAVAFDAATGALLWSNGSGNGGSAPPVVLDGTLYSSCWNLFSFGLPDGVPGRSARPATLRLDRDVAKP